MRTNWFLLFLVFTVLWIPFSSQAQKNSPYRYPVPDGFQHRQWKSYSREWGRHARHAQVKQQDGSLAAGFFLGAFPEGVALLLDEALPFVPADRMQVRLIPPEDIASITLRSLSYQNTLPLLSGLGIAAIQSPGWILFEQSIGQGIGYGLLFGTLVAAPAAAIAQLYHPYQRTYYLPVGDARGWTHLMNKLSRFNQVSHWEVALQLPEYAPEKANPEAIASLNPVMHQVEKAFRPHKWSASVSLSHPFYIGTNIFQVLANIPSPQEIIFTNPRPIPEISLTYAMAPRWQVGLA
ncbi:MAG TPA: hypothetical protein DCE41_08600 [Cytophagales bacterium]|nr:hypothetical protein [Cytophagales bacterium]